MNLYTSVSGAGGPVVLLHGLFGMGSNLGGLARALADDFEVHQLDLPNHGRSDWCDPMDLPSLASSIAAYCEERFLDPVVLIGHSLGGKVAMQVALTYPQTVRGIVAADIAPVAYEPSHAQVFAAIAAVREKGPSSRTAAAAVMREHLNEESVVQFLLLSLRRDDAGTYRWRFNADVLYRDYDRILAAPAPGLFEGPALFVFGALSNYVTAQGREAARRLFSNAQFSAIDDTGHWLHVEKADAFNARVHAFAAETLARRGTQPVDGRPEAGL